MIGPGRTILFRKEIVGKVLCRRGFGFSIASVERLNFQSWRRREGVEPSGGLTTPRLVLKTSGTTGHLPSPVMI